MSFLNPIWLWGLTALTIPIAIHMLSRKESKVIRLGSLRHLEEATTQQTLNLRLNEWMLLALRSTIIILLVLLLSGLRISFSSSGPIKWLLIERGIENDQQFKSLIDSLKEKGFSMRRFAKSFPTLENSRADSVIDYWKLIAELQSIKVDEAIVLSWNKLDGFHGKRIAKPDNIRWIAKSPEPSVSVFRKVKLSDDSVIVRNMHTGESETSFENGVVASTEADAVKTSLRDTITITVVWDTKYKNDNNIVAAALQAVATNPWFTIIQKSVPVNQVSTIDDSDWIVWLADEPKPAGIASNVMTMNENDNDNGDLFTRDVNCSPGNSCWIIAKRLRLETALNSQLTVALYSILTNDQHRQVKAELAAIDKRAQPEMMNWSSEQPVLSTTTDMLNPADAMICSLLAILLVCERLVAFKRNQ
ncbi:MAG TPA: BatA domain-containing protein [Chryseolinea sp.]|nr:BatA domain-containing protein [Chryseolinea sp.]